MSPTRTHGCAQSEGGQVGARPEQEEVAVSPVVALAQEYFDLLDQDQDGCVTVSALDSFNI